MTSTTPRRSVAAGKTIRAFLLPTKGAPTEFYIPVSNAAQRVIQTALGGCIERGFAGVGRYGPVAVYSDQNVMTKTPRPDANANVPDFLGTIHGPLLVVLEKNDGLASIPRNIKPSNWLTLYSE